MGYHILLKNSGKYELYQSCLMSITLNNSNLKKTIPTNFTNKICIFFKFHLGSLINETLFLLVKNIYIIGLKF